ncbi:hypothetical protein Poly24_44380 [Rosistilla carotiformis]|uniref:Uncharacterized protein n=1 Tax=Rosistilla carotiformis TaxID=2528017 RepID=A0A518JYT8_9BACT|nr:hypothetical protein [Rosistilla carotiformis]QDV70712.1 hypothetical protein Poly24_44380 [Rosistilla carotiformis]
MSISATGASFTSPTNHASGSNRGPSAEEKQEHLAAALQSIGVDSSTASDVLSQVEETVESLTANGSTTSRSSLRSAVEEVLEANGIDSAEVEAAIKANRPPGPPPRGPKPSDDDSTDLESALLSSNLDAGTLDSLLSSIVDTIQELTSDSATEVSDESIRSALTQSFEESGLDIDLLEQALGQPIGSSGSILNRLA